ncbi:MAG TPA: glycosyltransferase family 9 protein [Longimicrobiales bacterium]
MAPRWGRTLERGVRRVCLALARRALGARRPMPAEALAAPAFRADAVLLVRIDRLGDLLVSTPAIAAVRARFPAARLTLLVSPRTVRIAGWVPGVDEVLVFDRKRPASWPALLRALRARKFALAFDLNAAFSSTAMLLARLSGARCTATYDDPGARGWFDALFPVDPEGHQVRTHAGVGAVLGVAAPDRPVLDVPGGVPEIARRFLEVHGIGADEPVVVLNPNLTRERYRWPIERFAALGDRAAAAGARVIVSCAGAAERERALAVARQMEAPAAVLPGDWPLPDYVRFLRRASAFVSTMTGPAHVCEALGVPVVALCTPKQARGWRPLGAEHRVVVSTTDDATGIALEPVWAALEPLVRPAPAGRLPPTP